MKLELISNALCPYVHRATTMLNEKGVSYDVRHVDLQDKPEWFTELSPRGKVPLLVADGVVIFESAVICEYLDEVVPPRLLPEAPLERARQRAWVEVANDLFAADYRALYSSTREEMEAGLAATPPIFRRFEATFRGPFFAGESFGLVDVAVAPSLFKMLLLERHSPLRLLDGFPKARAWAERVASRPSVTAGVVAGFEAIYLAALRQRGSYFARTMLPPA